jgi:hypothetical protein
MNQMTTEELRVMIVINEKLASLNLESRLSRLYISGIGHSTITEWDWERSYQRKEHNPVSWSQQVLRS